MNWNSIVCRIGAAANHACSLNFHPSASGNVSLRVPNHFHEPQGSKSNQVTTYSGPWVPLDGTPLPAIGGLHFIVSASGSQLKHVASRPDQTLGVIELNDAGTAYKKIWGFARGEGKPTSELDTHLRTHAAVADTRNAGAVVHCHPPEIGAMMIAGLLKSSEDATRCAWQAATEGSVYLAGGVRVIPWCVPGTLDMGMKTAAEFQKGADVVLWDLHGALAVAPDIETAYGKIETFEHCMLTLARAISVTAANGTTPRFLAMQQLGELADAFRGRVPEANPELWNALADASEPALV
ncbi:MAG: class II aldolase/adducin family protein [Bdellovibrionota bacterium]